MQQIGLPVVLCNDAEIAPFLSAKREIETRFARQGVEVGGFFFQVDKTLRPENVRKTIRNSGRVRTIATQRSFVPGYIFKTQDGLEHVWAPLDVAHALTNRKSDLWLDFHLGIGARNLEGVTILMRGRKAMLSWIVQNLGEMCDRAKECGMGMLIESTPPMTFEEDAVERCASFFTLTTLPDLVDLCRQVGRSNLGITFDAAALGSVRASQGQDSHLRNLAARVNGFESWQGLTDAYGTVNEWAAAAREFHISNSTGIGVHLTVEQLRSKYGVMGTIEGALTREEFLSILRTAREKEAVCCIEVELDLARLTYEEDIRFLSWVYQNPQPHGTAAKSDSSQRRI